jgi:adenylate cyclase
MGSFASPWRPLAASLALAFVACGVVAGASQLDLFRSLELRGYDFLVWARGFEPPSEPIVVVDFDEVSVKELQAFPIPRRLLADVVEKIHAGGPSVVGLDVLLDEQREANDDARLAALLAQAGNVVLVENFGSERLLPSEPVSAFAAPARAVGFANIPVDEDGIIRRMYLLRRQEDYQGISFPVALAGAYLNPSDRGGWLKPSRPGSASPGSILLGELEVPLDDEGPYSALIGYWSPEPARVVTVTELLSPAFDPAIFRDKIVLVGQSSEIAKDLYATPVFPFWKPGEGRRKMSGVGIHAAALATLLTGKTIGILDPRLLWALNFFLIWLVIALVITARPLYSIPATVAGLFGTYLAAHALFSTQHIWMKFMTTEAGILLALPAGLGYRFLEERRLKAQAEAERQQLMGLFERYVSPEVASEIWTRRDEIVLAGEDRVATVLFSDIRRFTQQTAGRPSAEVLAWLNNYFTAMSQVIKENGGYLNKFIGDGLMVLFGVPLSEGIEEDACRAVRAALAMHAKLEELNAGMPPEWPRIKIGVGIHTGKLTAGNVGAQDRLEYSVVGETVNLASRLEALTKDFKTGLVISPDTRELVKNRFPTTPLGEANVRGFTGTIQLYTVPKQGLSPGEVS